MHHHAPFESPDSIAVNPDFTIPGYHIGRMLGRGGMAMVYLAVQESFGREVALKILPPTHARDPGFTERFLREARIVSRLVHPNIITVYDVGVHELYHYLSMEYVAGQDLRDAMATLSRSELLRAIIEVARALDYAGAKGYVHRDVKPENIMIRAEDGRVILMDFGIARGNDTTLDMTRDGRAIGTPYYMSPEQSRGSRVDQRSDLYSLGVVLYQMLTGTVPFDADSAVAVGIKHLTAPIPLLPGPLRCFQPVINTALAKDPEHRYQTGAEMIAALEQIDPGQLAKLDAEAASFRAAGQDYEADTLLGDAAPLATPPRTAITHEREAVLPGANEARTSDASTKVASAALAAAPVARPRRRRRLLLLVLLAFLAGFAGLKQTELITLWQHWQPRLTGLLTESTPSEPATRLADTNPVATTPGTPNRSSGEPPARDLTPSPEGREARTRPLPPLRQRIRDLRAGLDQHPENALELAGIYQELLQRRPDSPLPRKGLQALRRWYQQRTEALLQNGETAAARELLAQLAQSFPRAAASDHYRQLQARIERAETVRAHLRQAETYLAAGALTEPPQANALAELQAALALEPDNAEARTALWHIAETYLKQAEQAGRTEDYPRALRHIERGLKAVPDYAPLLALRETLQAAAQTATKRQARLDELLARAEQRRKAGKLIEPTGDSAWDYYRQALALDKTSTAAGKGMTRLEVQLAEKIHQLIKQGKLDAAARHLRQAEARLGPRPRLQQARRQLADAIEAQRPRISRIRLDSQPMHSLEPATAASLSPGRTLYAGFHYENFNPETTLLQAILLDGAGQVQIAQKPVIVNGPAGDHYFDIQLPVDGFSGGSYKLELRLDDKPLLSTAFVVNTQTTSN